MSGRVTVVGLGPGGFDRIAGTARDLLLDPDKRIIVRTLDHPAAVDLARLREVESADRFYEEAESFEEVYEQLAELAVRSATAGDDVVLAVPGSPLVAERTTRLVRARCAAERVPFEIIPAESFLDAVFVMLGVDPLEPGLQILDGRNLPDPLVLGLPTIIAQVDLPVVMADVAASLARTLPDGTRVTVLRHLGTVDAETEVVSVEELTSELAGPTTTLYVDPPEVGWTGLVHTMRRLRRECPWDAEQTHGSLVPHLIEETYELVDAVAALEVATGKTAGDGAYADLEEELGDLLLQVLFQTVIAREIGAFDVSDVVETLRRKLVRRHPHVFGDTESGSAEQVYARWEAIKATERGEPSSLMDRVPRGLPALQRAELLQERAARVGFDWDSVDGVADKVTEELGELRAELADPDAARAELGDLLFAVVNLARHLEIDSEIALRAAVDRFETRFRMMEAEGNLRGLDPEQLDRLWERAKAGGTES